MKVRGFYPYWRYHMLEKALNKASLQGQQFVKHGLFSAEYSQDHTQTYRYSITLCEAPKGSASRLQSLIAWQREGWEKVWERKNFVFYRCPVDSKAKSLKDNALPALLQRKIRSFELIRIVMLVLAVLCIMLGYAIDQYMIVRSSVIPLIIALLLTLVISKLQKALEYYSHSS